jgi:hypothetical protein
MIPIRLCTKYLGIGDYQLAQVWIENVNGIVSMTDGTVSIILTTAQETTLMGMTRVRGRGYLQRTVLPTLGEPQQQILKGWLADETLDWSNVYPVQAGSNPVRAQ